MTLIPNNPPPLFALAHRDDPETSRTAANTMNRTGTAQRHLDVVVDLVRWNPGRTAVELAALVPAWEVQEVRRRLTDGKRLGLLVQGDPRPCSVRGTRMVTWGVA